MIIDAKIPLSTYFGIWLWVMMALKKLSRLFCASADHHLPKNIWPSRRVKPVWIEERNPCRLGCLLVHINCWHFQLGNVLGQAWVPRYNCCASGHSYRSSRLLRFLWKYKAGHRVCFFEAFFYSVFITLTFLLGPSLLLFLRRFEEVLSYNRAFWGRIFFSFLVFQLHFFISRCFIASFFQALELDVCACQVKCAPSRRVK